MRLEKLVFKFLILISSLTLYLSSAIPVLAHATVKPNTAGVGSYTDFTVIVPSEKEFATTSVKLSVPEGLKSVTPVVKPGWTIQLTEATGSVSLNESGETIQQVTEIIWSGGTIPAERKDIFTFTAQVPAQPTELVWKIDQTYADGSVVSWSLGQNDAQPKNVEGKNDYSQFGPYSKTTVINDLKPPLIPDPPAPDRSTFIINSGPWAISLVALLTSIIALGITFKKSSIPKA